MSRIEHERTNPGKVYSFQKMQYRYNYAKKFLKGKVLDIGCGNGYGAELLEGFDYTGIDYYDKAIEKAGRTYPQAKFLRMTLPKLRFGDVRFDSIICSEVIEHLEEKDGQPLLNECYRVLKDGGVLYLTTPNGDNRDELMAHHLIEYGSKQLQDMVENAGFTITKKTGISIPFIYGWKWYPPGVKKVYERLDKKENSLKGATAAKPQKSMVGTVAKGGFKVVGHAMIRAGRVAPRKAEYQILVCKK